MSDKNVFQKFKNIKQEINNMEKKILGNNKKNILCKYEVKMQIHVLRLTNAMLFIWKNLLIQILANTLKLLKILVYFLKNEKKVQILLYMLYLLIT